MMAKWDAKEYGEQDQGTSHKDIWGAIKADVAKGWFIPSTDEIQAFVDELGIGESNYSTFNLNRVIWTSDQTDTAVWDLDTGLMSYSPCSHVFKVGLMQDTFGYGVRLIATY